jgi:hypothetical protein
VTESAPARKQPTVDDAIVELIKVLNKLERTDLAERAKAAGARLKRPNTIVCVVGEFKQGKSSLINALLGQTVCPVDDDLATSAITMVRFGEKAGATVRRADGDDKESIQIPIAELSQWVSETGNPGNEKGVERVEISVPSPLLKQGLVIVDTPGMGGLGAGHAAATLSFLPFADGLIFVSDVSTELSAPEIDFLRQAIELCPTVMFAQTKIDLYPEWERIIELNRGHLQRTGVQIPSVPVSSTLRSEALARKDRNLNELSKIPEVVKHLGNDVVKPAKANAAARSAADALSIVMQVRAGLTTEREVLADPASAQAALDTMNDAKARIGYLRGPGAKWSQLVGDRVSDLSNNINYEFRGSMRTVSRNMDERIEDLTSGDEWDELGRYLQTVVADQVAQVFVKLEEGRASIRDEVIEMLSEEDLQLGDLSALSVGLEVEGMWRSKSLEDTSTSGGKKALQTTITGIRGAQGGIFMFGMLGKYLPAAGTAILATNPVTLGIGALFGGMGLMDDKKRKVAGRRQAARSQMRQFADDVQFEVGNQISNGVKEIQRGLRDEFGERLAELLKTYTDTANRAQQDGKKSQADRQKRMTEIDASLKTLNGLDRFLAKAQA